MNGPSLDTNTTLEYNNEELIGAPISLNTRNHPALELLEETLNSDDLRELELILQDTDEKQREEYLVTLGEGHALRADIDGIAKAFVESLTNDIRVPDKSITLDFKILQWLKRRNFLQKFSSIRKLTSIIQLEVSSNIVRDKISVALSFFNKELSDILSQDDISAEELFEYSSKLDAELRSLITDAELPFESFRNKLLEEFVTSSIQYFMSALVSILNTSGLDTKKLLDSINEMRIRYMNEHKRNHDMALYGYWTTYYGLMSRDFPETIETLQVAREVDGGEEMTQEYISEIQRISEYRSLGDETIHIDLDDENSIQVIIQSPEHLGGEKRREYFYGLVTVNLKLNDTSGKPTIKDEETGYINFNPNDDGEKDCNIRFGVSRSTGQLTCFGYQADYKPILKPKKYKSFHWLVLKALHTHLSEKEDDLVSYINIPEVTTETQIDTVEEYVPQEDIGEEISPREKTRGRKNIFSRSISGQKFKQILDRMTGAGLISLIRTRGSHHIYRNEESGKRSPIAIHSNQNLNAGQIKTRLEQLGISMETFQEHFS